MTFAPDPLALRMYDEDRQLELVREGLRSGTLNYEPFKLRGFKFERQFYAKQTSIKEVFNLDLSDDEDQPCWLVASWSDLGGAENRELRKIVEEAMIAFKHSFGLGRPHWIYSVYFETEAGIVSADGDYVNG